jgi:2-polyprenyl-6-methoxyphenol hydroxylase-like FAD-dependent oxidoreductase
MPLLGVAVVGSGPAGVYAAAALTDRDEVAVDVIDGYPRCSGSFGVGCHRATRR